MPTTLSGEMMTSMPIRRNTKTEMSSKTNKNGNEGSSDKGCQGSPWMARYSKLKEFHKKNNHCNVNKKDDPSLGRWVARQRGERNHLLTAESRRLLDDLDFEWSIKQVEDQEVNWELNFVKLEKYLKEGNPCSFTKITKFDKTVGTWIANQRKRNHKGMLREDRKKRLESINFEFGEPGQPRQQKIGRAQRDQWEHMFKRLQEFKEKHGHTAVPYHYEKDRSLALWVSTQRREYNQKSWYGDKASINDDRRIRLEVLGFVWGKVHKKERTDSKSDEMKSDSKKTSLEQQQELCIRSSSRQKKRKAPEPNETHLHLAPSIPKKKRISPELCLKSSQTQQSSEGCFVAEV